MVAVTRHVITFRTWGSINARSPWLSHVPRCLSAPSLQSQCFSAGRQAAAKKVSKKQIKDLKQGTLQGDPLPPADKDELKQDSLTQVVRNCMRKFPDCVVLTRVGNFYEVQSSNFFHQRR